MSLAGINYQGRDGEMHIIDNSNASATTNATPWGFMLRIANFVKASLAPRS